MSFKEIKELRANGRIQEAYELAFQNYTADSNNIWNIRALSWVYYDYLKIYAEKFDKSQFIKTLKLIHELNLSADEAMFFDNMIWPISAVLRASANEQQIDWSFVNTIYTLIKDFEFSKPAKNYSILLQSLHKVFKDSLNYVEVINWWGLLNLLPEDYLETNYNDRKIMALAEQVYIAYAKSLLTMINSTSGNFSHEECIFKIKEFMPMLDKLIVNYPSYVYPSFFKAKLMLSLGDNQVLGTFIPFAKQKKNDFWVWQLMAEIHKDNIDVVLSCYCKALSLRTPGEFLVRIWQLLAEILISKKFYNEAKTEIDEIVREKNKAGLKIPNQLVAWQATSWYKEAKSSVNNKDFYNRYIDAANSLLYAKEEEELIVVEYVNVEKKIINFVKDKDKFGFFRYDGLIKNPKMGETYYVRLQHTKDAMYQLGTARLENTAQSESIKIVTGNLRLIPAGIGFVEDVFIDKSFIDNNKLYADQQIEIKALLSFNKKKNEWGWKALTIQTI